MAPQQLSGIIPALATPFTADEELNEEALRREIADALDQAGVLPATVG